MNTKPNLGSRFLAGFIDYFIIYGFTILLIITLGEPNQEGNYELNGLSILIPILFWLLLTVGLESGLGGTIGNSIVRLKAIPVDGVNRKLTFLESLKRHLLDPLDMSCLGLVGILTIKNTQKNQRVGGLWAKTIVVPMKDLA